MEFFCFSLSRSPFHPDRTRYGCVHAIIQYILLVLLLRKTILKWSKGKLTKLNYTNKKIYIIIKWNKSKQSSTMWPYIHAHTYAVRVHFHAEKFLISVAIACCAYVLLFGKYLIRAQSINDLVCCAVALCSLHFEFKKRRILSGPNGNRICNVAKSQTKN